MHNHYIREITARLMKSQRRYDSQQADEDTIEYDYSSLPLAKDQLII